VVAFHFGVPGFSGGFVGVDIFFVISGFLMTQIITERLDRKAFNIRDFYRARARRIVPALVVMLLVVLLIALLLIDPITAKGIAENALASALFLSNVQYGLESGYFAGAAEDNWLLHTWSLSVEWQFYLLYPLLLTAAAKFEWLWKRRFWASVISCATLFIATVIICSLSRRFLQMGFFILPTRAWEMLLGGCVAWLPVVSLRLPLRKIIGLAGAGMIAASVMVLDGSWPWPSAITAAPALGAALLLIANSSPLATINVRAFQHIGAWSYSIYLWHWPIVVAFSYLNIATSPVVVTAGVFLSIVAGAASYYFVENTFRRPSSWGSSFHPTWKGAAYILVLCVSATLILTDGLEGPKLALVSQQTANRLADYEAAAEDWMGGVACPALENFHEGKKCVIGAPLKGTLVIGDSHAEQLIPRFTSSSQPITFLYNAGCLPLLGVNRTTPGYDCTRFTRAALREAEAGNYSKVVLVTAWQVYLPTSAHPDYLQELCAPLASQCVTMSSLEEFDALLEHAVTRTARRLAALKSAGKSILIVGPYPNTGALIGAPANQSPTAEDLFRASYLSGAASRVAPVSAADFRELHSFTYRLIDSLANQSGSTAVDQIPNWCDPECSVYDDGDFMFTDSHHIRDSEIKSDDFAYWDAIILPEPG
jgi:peptidoglycan/LPS O-acetylase OafA/YrhL